MSKTKNFKLKQSKLGQSVFFRAQNALCGKTGGTIIRLLVSYQNGMVFSSYPTLLCLVRVNPPIPTRFWCRNQKIWGKRILSLKAGIVGYERLGGWYAETEPGVLEHQMALLQLLLWFSATDHGDCHFREESLEKVTVLTSKRRKPASRTQ
jgi:hypothetical protein